jgi:hypothetical protein
MPKLLPLLAALAALAAAPAAGQAPGATVPGLVACSSALPFLKARAMGIAPEIVAILQSCTPLEGERVRLVGLRLRAPGWQVWHARWRDADHYVLVRTPASASTGS